MKNEMKTKVKAIKFYSEYFKCSEKEARELNAMTIDCMVKFSDELLKQEPDKENSSDCIHFDYAQGRNKCCNDKVKSNRCIGVECGEFQGKNLQKIGVDEKLFIRGKDKLIKKLHSMRYTKKEVQGNTSPSDNQFMYGYTECINELLIWANKEQPGIKPLSPYEGRTVITSKDLRDLDEIK